MSKPAAFEREDRYIVIKRKHLSEEQVTAIDQTLEMYDVAQVPLAVVVEGDWPEYEPVWSMIQERVTGEKMEPAMPPVDREKWTYRWCGSGMWHGYSIWTVDCIGCHKNLVEELGPDIPGDSVRRIIAAHNVAIERLNKEIDAYRLLAVNEGWSWPLVEAYGHKEYVRQRIASVDASAAGTISSGYDAAAYLRDHSAPADSTS